MLVRAKEELARLDGMGHDLPNPQLLLTPLQRREAQHSSSLEGTYATPQQLLLFEINPAEVEIADDKDQPVREVANYNRALSYRKEVRHNLPISLRLIRDLHRVLLDGVRGSTAEPGEFRRGQVQIDPFRDGNGRVGRLLLAITIEDWCNLSGQWLYMSAFFDKHKDEYIDRLFCISTEGDWTGWINFCRR